MTFAFGHQKINSIGAGARSSGMRRFRNPARAPMSTLVDIARSEG